MWCFFRNYVIENLQNLRLLRGISQGSNPSTSVGSLTYPKEPDYSFWHIWTTFWIIASCHTSLEDVLFGIFSLSGTVGYSLFSFRKTHLSLPSHHPPPTLNNAHTWSTKFHPKQNAKRKQQPKCFGRNFTPVVQMSRRNHTWRITPLLGKNTLWLIHNIQTGSILWMSRSVFYPSNGCSAPGVILPSVTKSSACRRNQKLASVPHSSLTAVSLRDWGGGGREGVVTIAELWSVFRSAFA